MIFLIELTGLCSSKKWIIVLFFLLFFNLSGQQLDAAFPKHNPVPGGLAVVYLSVQSNTTPRVSFGRKSVLVLRNGIEWYAIIGLSKDTIPGNYVLSVSADQHKNTHQLFRVDPFSPSKSHDFINLSSKFQNLDWLSCQVPVNLLDWSKNLSESSLVPDLIFSHIVKFEKYLPYGTLLHRKKLNHEDDISIIDHDWITYLTKMESLVLSPGTAVVEKIFKNKKCGTSIILNHGIGARSILYHIENVIVEVGHTLQTGQIIGSSGPSDVLNFNRVDWIFSLNDNQINPLQFVPFN